MGVREAWNTFWEHANLHINTTWVCYLPLSCRIFVTYKLCQFFKIQIPCLSKTKQISAAQVDKVFHLAERKSCFTQELRAGTVTFLTVCPSPPYCIAHTRCLVCNCCIDSLAPKAAPRSGCLRLCAVCAGCVHIDCQCTHLVGHWRALWTSGLHGGSSLPAFILTGRVCMKQCACRPCWV